MTEATIVQHDEKAERAVLGAMMVSETAIDAALGATSIESAHYFARRHRAIHQAIAALAARGEGVDAMTVADELGPGGVSDIGGQDYLFELVQTTAVPGNAGQYARIVIEKAQWRNRRQAIVAAGTAVQEEDEKGLNAAMAQLHADALDAEWETNPRDIGMAVLELAEGKAADELLEWPYPRLNHLRPMYPGNLIVLTGPSHHGKSLTSYAILDHLFRKGKSVHAYINEMTATEIGLQNVWRRAAIPTDRLMLGQLDQQQHRDLLKTMNDWNGNGWGVTEIHGWSAERVANHIQRHRRDLVVVDVLHNFDYEHERELDHIVNTLQIAAKRSNTCVVLVAHINRNRSSQNMTGEVPKPKPGDLRGSGGIYNRADVVACVWREQDDETSEPLEDGVIYLIKARLGKLGGFPMRFDETRGRFLPVDKRPEPTDRYMHDPEEKHT